MVKRHRRRRTRSRPLTGARIETTDRADLRPSARVAPSRGRGSKPPPCANCLVPEASPPHGGADRNVTAQGFETLAAVAPSRGRGSKRSPNTRNGLPWMASPPHGGADRNMAILHPNETVVDVAPSRGRGSKQACTVHHAKGAESRPLTGARIETKANPARPMTW